MPYECARAICLTFCYPIRWAVTPIFGPSFVRECLQPGTPDFAKFRVDAETVRCAQLEAEGWKQPRIGRITVDQIPRSVPAEATETTSKHLRPRTARPTFKDGSPFESDGDTCDESSYSVRRAAPVDSPGISPKTSMHEIHRNPGWTSINRSRSPPPPPTNTPITSLSRSLLAQPRYCPWRPADSSDADHNTPRVVKMPTGPHERHCAPKRRRSSTKAQKPDAEYKSTHSSSDGGESSSESDDVDIIVSPPAAKKRARGRRQSKERTGGATTSSPSNTGRRRRVPESTLFTAQDFRAAKALLDLQLS